MLCMITWRGLAALLILEERQCEGLTAGMGESRNSHAFFVSIFNLLLTAEFWEFRKQKYWKKRVC